MLVANNTSIRTYVIIVANITISHIVATICTTPSWTYARSQHQNHTVVVVVLIIFNTILNSISTITVTISITTIIVFVNTAITTVINNIDLIIIFAAIRFVITTTIIRITSFLGH